MHLKKIKFFRKNNVECELTIESQTGFMKLEYYLQLLLYSFFLKYFYMNKDHHNVQAIPDPNPLPRDSS